jgi:hypothetical protein
VEFDLKGLLLSDLKLLGFLLHLVTHRQKLISLNLKKKKKKNELAFLVEDYVCFKRHDPQHVLYI